MRRKNLPSGCCVGSLSIIAVSVTYEGKPREQYEFEWLFTDQPHTPLYEMCNRSEFNKTSRGQSIFSYVDMYETKQ